MKTIDDRLEIIDAFEINKNKNKVEVFGRNNRFLYNIVNDIQTGKSMSEEKIAKPFWYNFPSEWDFGYPTMQGFWWRWAPSQTTGTRGIWPKLYRVIGRGNLVDGLRWYEDSVCNIRRLEYDKYIDELAESISDIKLYQGSIDEVSRETGRQLEMLDLGTAETFIEVDKDYGYVRVQEESLGPFTSDFMLRLKAKEIGADAVVHYMPGSSIGTPVRFIKDKNGAEGI